MRPPEVIASPTGEAAQSFFAREERILNDLAGKSTITWRRGEQWAVDPETGSATYDPKFFEEKGYTPSQALFASFHEVKCHVVEVAELLDSDEGDKAYQRLKQRSKRKHRVHIWENCRTDAKGNLAIRQLAPSLAEDTEALYRERLFPKADLTESPRHLQFAYAVLRESMLPEETVVGSEVREAINGLKNVQGRDGRTRDVIRLVTDPGMDPLLALKLSERYIEPVIDKLFEKDVEDKKQQQQGQGQPNQGQGQGDPQDSFADDYKDYEENIHPQPLEDENVDKKIKEVKQSQEAARREDEAYQQEHSVSIKELGDYNRDYTRVAPQIEPYKDIFRRIAEQRQVVVKRLKSLKEEGVMVDPGLIAQGYVDIRAGTENPRIMRDFEGTIIPENVPREADVYFVKDQSPSMRNEKAEAQRLGAIIETEALQEGQEIMDEERLPDPLALQINTAVIGFGVGGERTKVYKALSKGLDEAQRVAIYKGLLELGNVGTNDYDALVLVEKDIRQRMDEDPVFAEELRLGRRKVAAIITTDGGSNYEGFTDEQARARTRKKAEDLKALGIKVKAIALVPNSEDERNIKEVYGADDTVICTSADNYTESTKQVLEKDVLGPLSFTGNIEDIL